MTFNGIMAIILCYFAEFLYRAPTRGKSWLRPCRKHFDIWNRLGMTHECDRQTDRQTYGQTDSLIPESESESESESSDS